MKHLLLALLLLIASSGSAVGNAFASTRSVVGQDLLTHPRVMQDVANRVAMANTGTLNPFTLIAPQTAIGGAGGPQREIFGFALASSLSDPTVGYPTWNFSLLTTVAFFGLHVQDDGSFATDSGWNVWNSSQLTGLLTAAHSQGTKVVLTIILQDFGPGTPHMCAGLAHSAATVANTVAQVKAKGVDGVNVDFEGLNGSCGTADPSWARHATTNFATSLRSALPPGSYLSIDTYASSAADPLGFFDVGGLNPSVDSFFVMAYDLEYSNWARAPANCSSFCLGPTAPLGGYYYNDTSTVNQYVGKVPASKVILGVPYYGRKACVAGAAPNPYPLGAVVADSYLDASSELTSPGPGFVPGTYTAHRDANDPAGQERWDTWANTTLNCARELYWDDVISLGLKYDLVNSSNLRGVGIWTLNYGGGAPELWSSLNTHFSCPVQINLPASQTTTQFSISLSAPNCSVASFEVQQYDSTLNQGWFALTSVRAVNGSASALADGYPGYAYQYRARAHTTSGSVSAWSTAATSVSASATVSHPFKGVYTLDGWGGVHGADSPPLNNSAYWPGWNIARAAHALPVPVSPQAGAVLDGYGGLHSYGAPIALKYDAYWSGWDIARDFAFLPNASGGVVLDGYGGLHAFHVNGNTAAITVQTTAYWPGWDIARKVVIFADGTGGYVLDGWGGLHPFGINGPPPVSAAKLATTGYWPGWSIARDVVLVPGNGGHSGYVLDGWGGLHEFHPTTDGSTMPAPIRSRYWPGWDIARGVWLLPGSATAGYTLDGWGGLQPFGGAPPIGNSTYWPGWDIAKMVWGA